MMRWGLVLMAMAGMASAREVTVLKEGWRFTREEHPAQMRYFPYDRCAAWLDDMGDELLETPRASIRPAGEPDVVVSPFHRPNFNDAKWERVTVPHDWGIGREFLPDLSHLDAHLDCTGTGWYRRRLESLKDVKGRRVFFECDGAMSFAMVWINGHFVGGWPYGYTPWRVELTQWVKGDGSDLLAVRCHNWTDASRWYTGAGLYRECRLVVEEADHVVPGSVYIVPKVNVAGNSDGGVLATSATVHVEYEMTVSGRKSKTFTIANPRLWDVDDPQLYDLELEGRTFRYGIRTISFHADERGFQLNGRRVPIRGMCLHHDLGVLGAAFDRGAQRRRLLKLREAGVNAIRMSHNEPDPKFLDLCDEMGFLVMDEVFDQWSICKSGNDYGRLHARWWEKDLRRWLRTDRNHPSVIIWGFGNEIMESRMTDKERELFKTIARRMVRICHQEDPTRPATTACDNPVNAHNGYAEIPDIYGFNYRPAEYAAFATNYPAKPVFGSETICQLSSRGEYYFPVNFRRSRDAYGSVYRDFHASSYGWEGITIADVEWEGQARTPRVMGDFCWTGFDYLAGTFSSPMLRRHPVSSDPEVQRRQEAEVERYGSVRGGMHTCPTGLFDSPGFPKDEFYHFQSRWRPDLPMAHILPHWNWPEREGTNVPVYVYSTGDEVELFVNGTSAGRRRREPGLWRFCWNDVVYHPGSLRAVAYRQGKAWAEAMVETTGPAAKVTIEPEAERAIPGECAFITIAVRDAAGRLVQRSRNEVTVAVEGADFAGMDSGDEGDFTAFRSQTRRVFNGLLGLVVRPRSGQEKVTVRATAAGLSEAVLTLPIR